MAKQFRNLFPIHLAHIETQSHPTSRPDVGRHVEPRRVGSDQRVIVAGQDFAAEADNAISMMVVQEICEGFSAYPERRVAPGILARCFGQGETNFRHPREARIAFHGAIYEWPSIAANSFISAGEGTMGCLGV